MLEIAATQASHLIQNSFSENEFAMSHSLLRMARTLPQSCFIGKTPSPIFSSFRCLK
jgi:hypothetical protein